MVDLLGNIFDEVYSLIKSWRPSQQYNSEGGYRDDLLRFLRMKLNKPDLLGMPRQHSIQKEDGRGLADIGIDRRVAIEVKFNLKGKSKADRLKGQVETDIREYEEGVIIVACGKTDRDTIEYLKPFLAKFSEPTLLGGKRVEIIIKSRAHSQKKQPTVFDFELSEINLPDIV
jgi:hypothetical protein